MKLFDIISRIDVTKFPLPFFMLCKPVEGYQVLYVSGTIPITQYEPVFWMSNQEIESLSEDEIIRRLYAVLTKIVLDAFDNCFLVDGNKYDSGTSVPRKDVVAKIPPQLRPHLFKKGSPKAKKHGAKGGRAKARGK